MGFSEAPQPDVWEMAVPHDMRPTFVMALPNLTVLAADDVYWGNRHEAARVSGDARAEATAAQIKNELRLVAQSGVRLKTLANNNHLTDAHYDEGVRWYDHATAYFAWSRMWREIHQQGASGIQAEAAELRQPAEFSRMVPDIGDYRHTAIHIPRTLLGSLFKIESPQEDAVWFRGETVFITVSDFDPSPQLAKGVSAPTAHAIGKAFAAEEFVTTKAFLKSAFWQTYPPAKKTFAM